MLFFRVACKLVVGTLLNGDDLCALRGFVSFSRYALRTPPEKELTHVCVRV